VNRALVALFAAALVLIGVELVLAARTSPVRIASPCAARPLFPGHGLDAGTQRVVLDGLGRAACSLGVSREALVLSFAGSGDGLGRPKPQVERAVRLPGISRWALGSVRRSQSQAYWSHCLRYSLGWWANQVYWRLA